MCVLLYDFLHTLRLLIQFLFSWILFTVYRMHFLNENSVDVFLPWANMDNFSTGYLCIPSTFSNIAYYTLRCFKDYMYEKSTWNIQLSGSYLTGFEQISSDKSTFYSTKKLLPTINEQNKINCLVNFYDLIYLNWKKCELQNTGCA